MRDIDRLVQCAQTLRSERNENKEYDRALVELCVRFAGYSHDEGDARFELLIGIGEDRPL